MGTIWSFVLGVFVGGVIGVFLMAMVTVGKDDRSDQDHQKRL